VQHEAELVVRDLVPDDYAVARRIVATAFGGEPFAAAMFGASPLDRFVGMAEQYDSWPWGSNPVVVGAEVRGSIVGVAMATLPGACHLCDDFDTTDDPTATTAQRIEREFQVACREAHAGARLPPHAHITTVATDPFLAGCGVGRRVVGELVARLGSVGARCAVLECLTTREQFYANVGFQRVVEFDDPGGPGLRSVLMRTNTPR
jgi:ribosomal protein S18 acetylase RimI-like enzyme